MGVGSLPRRVAVFNHKGGVGKTTLTAHLAVALAGGGSRVLAVDLDPQGQLALSFATARVRRRPDVYALYRGDRPLPELIQPANAAQSLYLVAGHPDTEQADKELSRGDDPFWFDIMRQRLQGHEHAWDYVLFDCHPSFSAVNVTALYYADEIWLPVRLDAYSLDSYMRLEDRLLKLRKSTAMITNVIPTHFDVGARQSLRLLDRARDHASLEALDGLRQLFGDRIAPPVRNSSLFRAAAAAGETLWTFAPASDAASDLSALVDHIKQQEKGR